VVDAMADNKPSNVSEELYAEMCRHFSKEQLIELAASTALEPSRYNVATADYSLNRSLFR
jgi:hypothetical protein